MLQDDSPPTAAATTNRSDISGKNKTGNEEYQTFDNFLATISAVTSCGGAAAAGNSVEIVSCSGGAPRPEGLDNNDELQAVVLPTESYQSNSTSFDGIDSRDDVTETTATRRRTSSRSTTTSRRKSRRQRQASTTVGNPLSFKSFFDSFSSGFHNGSNNNNPYSRKKDRTSTTASAATFSSTARNIIGRKLNLHYHSSRGRGVLLRYNNSRTIRPGVPSGLRSGLPSGI